MKKRRRSSSRKRKRTQAIKERGRDSEVSILREEKNR